MSVVHGGASGRARWSNRPVRVNLADRPSRSTGARVRRPRAGGLHMAFPRGSLIARTLAPFLFVFVAFQASSAGAGVRATTTLPGPLFGVDALSSNDVWAVGAGPNPADPDDDIGQAQHWDGSSWTELSTPGFGE